MCLRPRANRLGANSLLDIVVFGRETALDIAENNDKGAPHLLVPDDIGQKSLDDLDRIRTSDGDILTARLRSDMQRAMQNDVAVFRTHDSLAEGYERIQAVELDFVNRLAVKDHSLIWNSDLIETFEMRNLITCAS